MALARNPMGGHGVIESGASVDVNCAHAHMQKLSHTKNESSWIPVREGTLAETNPPEVFVRAMLAVA